MSEIISQNKIKHKKWSPYLFILLGFLGFIIVGTMLLMLPFSVADGQNIKFVDALFTSTSAVCVTGLSSIADIGATLSVFGKIVLALLIQVGGLGFVTTAMFVFTLMGLKIGLNDRFLIKETLNQNSSGGLVRFLKRVMLLTFIFEGVGMLLNFIVFIQEFSFWQALGISAFHAISSFNNAGFDILGSVSLINYSTNALLLINTAFLIIFGGLGFLVINEVITKRKWSKFSVHTKIVLIMTASLIIIGMLALKLTEYGNITWLEAFFHSVSTRTAGFAVFNNANLRSSSLIITMALMFIGASPCSTGGGIKTTTLFVLGASIKSFATGKDSIVFYRKVSNGSMFKAYILTLMALIFIIFATLSLTIIENSNIEAGTMSITSLLYETISAFATVGLSMGVTTSLSSLSKIIICTVMYFGRLGPLTIISLLNKNWNKTDDNSIKHVDARIIIG